MKIRHFIGATVIALTVMLSPAPTQSAVVESAVEVDLVTCTFIFRPHGVSTEPFLITLPRSVAEILDAPKIVGKCDFG